MTRKDRNLGMDRPIDRRDFLNGVAVSAAAAALPAGALAQAEPFGQDHPGYDPPRLTGLRGSHPGSFEAAHEVRDGDFWSAHPNLVDTGEAYDLVIVGGGMSGLAAAHFFSQAKPDARILILDNHDDFGGHAKRNEFHLGGKLQLLDGGTLEIDSPYPYSPAADGVLRFLGIDPPALAKACDRDDLYSGMGLGFGVFFDKETFGTDRLVVGAPSAWMHANGSWAEFVRKTPLDPAAQADILRIQTGMEDYLPGLTSEEKKDRLWRISYLAYLRDLARCHPQALAFYQSHTHGEWGVGIDAVSALDCWGIDLPGFQGLKLTPHSIPQMGYTPAGYIDTGGSYRFHFPDGNASIARALVRSLVPGVAPGAPADAPSIVAADFDYARLDRPGQNVRIRLSSLCVRARNLAGGKGVQIAYTASPGGGPVKVVTGKAAILASWNMMIPYLCPEMGEAQKAAMHALVKTPLVYTSVALRNWTAFQRLGLMGAQAPGSYHTSVRLNWPVAIGGCSPERDPQKPILVHMVKTPCLPGLTEFEQNKAGRAELLATPFSVFEEKIRDQLGRMLSDGGFDPARDITAITVNRWPHGYAPEYNPLFQPLLPEAERPYVIARQRFGLISIANSDCGGGAYTSCAIDQARRAVDEVLGV